MSDTPDEIPDDLAHDSSGGFAAEFTEGWEVAEPPAVPTPEPVIVEICSVCRQPWRLHLKRALHESYGEDVIEGEEFFPPRSIHAGDCIALLKIANAGPIGETGPPGAPGVAGKVTWDRVLFERDIKTSVQNYLAAMRIQDAAEDAAGGALDEAGGGEKS